MNTFNVQLKNGNYLNIPAEYYPRFASIVAAKENLLCLTPISRVEAFLKTIGRTLFNPTFAVLSIINLSLCTPLLITNSPDNPKTTYYFYLSLGFIISYYLTKIHIRLTNKHPLSLDGLAQQLGYKSFASSLKPYDERMIKAIIAINKIKIRRTTLFFDDLYGILFDEVTSRRLYDIFRPTHLRVIK
ncbi:MAG: hypothetical protein QM652_05415 [Legionella sp.]|uniref:hypothetical protein n=1 Tax=Legionella sp. TaxID=459 RepID=UPI0039E51B56